MSGKMPVVDLSACIRCGVCIDVCPAVFSETDAGIVLVAELDDYPEAEVDDAIKNCPKDCIFWEEA